MDSTTSRLPRLTATVVVSYFIAFTALCWFLDFAQPGKIEAQERYCLFFTAGIVTGLFALVGSVALWRFHRRLAMSGLIACLLWTVWAMLPRL